MFSRRIKPSSYWIRLDLDLQPRHIRLCSSRKQLMSWYPVIPVPQAPERCMFALLELVRSSSIFNRRIHARRFAILHRGHQMLFMRTVHQIVCLNKSHSFEYSPRALNRLNSKLFKGPESILHLIGFILNLADIFRALPSCSCAGLAQLTD